MTRNNKHRPYGQMPEAGRWCNMTSQEMLGTVANLTVQIPPKGVQIPMFGNIVLAAFNSENKDWPASSLGSLTRRSVFREGKRLVYLLCLESQPTFNNQVRTRQEASQFPSFGTGTEPALCLCWVRPTGKSRAFKTNDLRSLLSLSFQWDTQTRKQTLPYSKDATLILGSPNSHEDTGEENPMLLKFKVFHLCRHVLLGHNVSGLYYFHL